MEKFLCILSFGFVGVVVLGLFLFFLFFFPSCLMVILQWWSGWCLMSVLLLNYDKDAEMFCPLQDRLHEWKTSHRIIVNNMHVLGTLLTKPCAYNYTL